ncbi:hypothetical protein [Neobacillus massiliamazoniensis]|uniref:hypothetical protein n=1 Tax=Neobacillus massiliamazoniensis TaxID=1499688 RepID=UPI001146A086|nr:hypothetical protein [Neobacillus massiliamazoniensis]
MALKHDEKQQNNPTRILRARYHTFFPKPVTYKDLHAYIMHFPRNRARKKIYVPAIMHFAETGLICATKTKNNAHKVLPIGFIGNGTDSIIFLFFIELTGISFFLENQHHCLTELKQ